MLYGSYAGAMQNSTPEEIALDDAFQALIKVGWERPTPEFRRVFTTLMIPDASEEQMSWVDELQRMAATADTAMLARSQRRQADARHVLPRLDLPTLVLHSRGDRMNNFDESRYLAAHIPAHASSPSRARTTSSSRTSRRGRPCCGRSPSSSHPTGPPATTSADAGIDELAALSAA